MLLGLAGCTTPAVVGQIASAHPGATYEAAATGCEQLRRNESRRFGSDLRGAVLWARQKVGGAQALPCEVVLDAVHGDRRVRAYVLSRPTPGRRSEQVIRP